MILVSLGNDCTNILSRLSMVNSIDINSLISKTVNAKKLMVSFTHQNFDVENEAHRKIDDYPHRDHPDGQLNT